jgi:hypothetical protein
MSGAVLAPIFPIFWEYFIATDGSKYRTFLIMGFIISARLTFPNVQIALDVLVETMAQELRWSVLS